MEEFKLVLVIGKGPNPFNTAVYFVNGIKYIMRMDNFVIKGWNKIDDVKSYKEITPEELCFIHQNLKVLEMNFAGAFNPDDQSFFDPENFRFITSFPNLEKLVFATKCWNSFIPTIATMVKQLEKLKVIEFKIHNFSLSSIKELASICHSSRIEELIINKDLYQLAIYEEEEIFKPSARIYIGNGYFREYTSEEKEVAQNKIDDAKACIEFLNRCDSTCPATSSCTSFRLRS